mmetsp:Transcript_9769/g.23486  ORF Transcript_9769/g.23486 Transcript_9769/m.23486 type:complete len:287 (+) Transcript_9769:1755-2615(+)
MHCSSRPRKSQHGRHLPTTVERGRKPHAGGVRRARRVGLVEHCATCFHAVANAWHRVCHGRWGWIDGAIKSRASYNCQTPPGLGRGRRTAVPESARRGRGRGATPPNESAPVLCPPSSHRHPCSRRHRAWPSGSGSTSSCWQTRLRRSPGTPNRRRGPRRHRHRVGDHRRRHGHHHQSHRRRHRSHPAGRRRRRSHRRRHSHRPAWAPGSGSSCSCWRSSWRRTGRSSSRPGARRRRHRRHHLGPHRGPHRGSRHGPRHGRRHGLCPLLTAAQRQLAARACPRGSG